MHDVKAAHRIRVQTRRFSGKLSSGLPKVARRAVEEVLHGIQARGSVKLSEIARSLGEPTSLKKVIERLGRQIGRQGLRETVRENLLRQAAPHVGKDTLLIADPTDLTRPYARKMEYLANVRDGSTKRIGAGYWCMTVVAAHRGTAQIVPLYQELYSQASPDFQSENDEVLKAVDAVAAATGARGIWVMDRGGDRRRILGSLLDSGRRFLFRMRGDRHLLYRGQSRSTFEIAASCRLPHRDNLQWKPSSPQLADTQIPAISPRGVQCWGAGW